MLLAVKFNHTAEKSTAIKCMAMTASRTDD